MSAKSIMNRSFFIGMFLLLCIGQSAQSAGNPAQNQHHGPVHLGRHRATGRARGRWLSKPRLELGQPGGGPGSWIAGGRGDCAGTVTPSSDYSI